jgi:hypothetical protein
VRRILQHRVGPGQPLELLVEWEGYPKASDRTWLRVEAIRGGVQAPMVRAFLEAQLQAIRAKKEAQHEAEQQAIRAKKEAEEAEQRASRDKEEEEMSLAQLLARCKETNAKAMSPAAAPAALPNPPTVAAAATQTKRMPTRSASA